MAPRLAYALFALLSLAAGLRAQYAVEVVARAGDVLPGLLAGESVSTFRGSSDEEAPRLADDGTILSETRLAGTTGGADAALVLYAPAAAPLIAHREGDPAPGLAGVTVGQHSSASLAFATDGTLAWQANLAGTGVNSANDFAFFLRAGGTSSLVLREGQSVSFRNAAGGSSSVAFAPSGTRLWAANNGVWAFTQGGALFRREGETFQRLFAIDDLITGTLVWRGLTDGRMAPDGAFLTQASSRLGAAANAETYGLTESSGGTTIPLLRAGETAPGLPAGTLGSYAFKKFALADGGRWAAIMSVTPAAGGFATDALFLSSTGAAPERALQIGDAVPGTAAGTVNNLFRLEAAGPWVAAWVGVANAPGVTSAVLRRRFDNPAWETVITGGQPAADHPALAVGGFSQLALGADGTVVLRAAVVNYPAGGTASTAGLFVFRDSRLELPVYVGGEIPGGWAVGSKLQLFQRDGTTPGSFGEGQGVNSAGQVALRVLLFPPGVVGTAEALLRLSPPAPAPTRLTLTARRDGEVFRLRVPSRSGFRYVVAESPDLANWTPTAVAADGTGDELELAAPLPTAPGRRFLRVEEYRQE